MRILLADDDPLARDVGAALLTQWDYEPVLVADGLEALAVLGDEDGPCVALLDWIMPGMDGVEICRRVRDLKLRVPRYLILLTCRCGPDAIVEALEAGADDFLTKPFDERELRARLGVGSRLVQVEHQLHERMGQLRDALGEIKRLQLAAL